MKLSVAIAGEHALPSAFVVFRGFEKSIQKAAWLGFNGVELALRRAEEIDPAFLRSLLDTHGLEVSCISTGQVYADGGLRLTHEDVEKRNDTIRIFKALIDLAGEFGQIVNIGRVRGAIGNKPRSEVEGPMVTSSMFMWNTSGISIMLGIPIFFISATPSFTDTMKSIS